MTSPEFRKKSRLFCAALVATLAVSCALAGCSFNGQAKPKPTPSSSSAVPQEPPAVTEIIDTPGSGEGLVGALADSVVNSCALSEGAWKVDGKVTNPTEAPVNYRIYVSLLAESGETRGLQQVNVDAVDAAASSDWSTTLALAEEKLSCVLRVERYPA
ncbi:MAG: hypothetical protein ACRCSP_04725 [Rhodoglobus sp.]